MRQVQNYTLFDFVWMLCDCVYIDFPLALGAICFQRCVGRFVCMSLSVAVCAILIWYMRAHATPSLAVALARIQVVPPWQCYHPKRKTASP